jgi:ubiquinone/menaquinone biosynthesis C-methylase UbiE
LSFASQIWDNSGGAAMARLRAWWYGVEFRDLSPPPMVEEESLVETTAEEAPLDRLALLQQIWGQGFLMPGGTDQIMTLVKPFGVNPAMSLLDLSAGLGGASRHVSATFDVYITAMERSAEIARRGHAMSVDAGLGRKVAVSAYDPESVELRPHAFDAVYAQFLTTGVTDKERLLREVMRCLKPRGQFSFLDFALREAEADDPRVEKLRRIERYPVLPWRVSQFIDALTAASFDCRIAEDHTEIYRARVMEGLTHIMQMAEAHNLPKSHLLALLEEAELWGQRMAVIDSGALSVYRFYAVSTQGAVM